MPLFMQTTKIPAERTAGEITKLLIDAGATDMYQKYTEKKIVGFSFQLSIDGKPTPFNLPIRLDPVFKAICKSYSPGWINHYRYGDKRKADLMLQAERVAWRQILRWLQAQIALIDTGMVKIQEVFLPYYEVAPGVTLFNAVEQKQLALPAYGGDQTNG